MMRSGGGRIVSVFVLFSVLVGTSFFPLSCRAAAGYGDEEVLQRSRLRMNRVVKQLMDEKKAWSKTKEEEDGLLVELEEIDKKMAAVETRLAFLDKQRQRADQDLPRFAEQVRQGQVRVEEMRHQLNAHLRLMYGLGGQGMVKIAFSQEDSSRLRQGVLYYGRLIQARNARFKAFQQSVQTLNHSVAEHQSLVDKVAALSQELSAEKYEDLIRRQRREALLDSLREEQSFRERKITELRSARSSLTHFMQRLSRLLEKEEGSEIDSFAALGPIPSVDVERRRPAPTPTALPKQNTSVRSSDTVVIASPEPLRRREEHREQKEEEEIQETDSILDVKGHLSLPVDGQGQERKPGLFFHVEEGTPVRAVHQARVVYADWFRGYGLLVILDHGHHIYSLYGHNRTLLVTPGDWVMAQQVIAQTGDTGSLEGVPGLYFEIRQQGEAENPRYWLSASR